MDIKQRLSEEHSKSLTMAVVDYIAEDKTKFKILAKRNTFRAKAPMMRAKFSKNKSLKNRRRKFINMRNTSMFLIDR